MKKFCLALLAIFLFCGAGHAITNEEFFKLCANGTLQQIQTAIESGADVNVKGEYDMTPLFEAAGRNSNPEVITALIKAGAEVNAKDENGMTPLMAGAGFNPNLEVITALINAGAEVNAKAENGITPLMAAADRNSNPEVITTLINAGADAKIKDKYRQRAIDYAEQNEKLKGTDAYLKLRELSF